MNENRLKCSDCGEISNPPMSSWGDVCPKCGGDILMEVEISACPEERDCHSQFHDQETGLHVYPVT